MWHEIADYTGLTTLTEQLRDHVKLGEKASDISIAGNVQGGIVNIGGRNARLPT